MFYPFKLDSQDILSMQLSLAKRNTMLIEFCEITLSKDVAILFIKPVIASPSCHARHYYIRHVIQTQSYTSKTHVISHCTHGIGTFIVQCRVSILLLQHQIQHTWCRLQPKYFSQLTPDPALSWNCHKLLLKENYLTPSHLVGSPEKLLRRQG